MPGRSAGLRKLDSESLYYSCQVCSNHVGYFNKREQQGETGSLVLRLLLRPSLSSPSSSSRVTLSIHTHTHTHSTASVYRLRLYRDFDDPVTLCVFACSFSPMLKILGSPRIQMEIRIFFAGNPRSSISRCSLSVSLHPHDSLISERPTGEHASDIFIFDIRRTISLAEDARACCERGEGSDSAGWKWMVDCARARWRKRIVGPVSRLGLKARASSFPFVRKRASGIPGGDEQRRSSRVPPHCLEKRGRGC